MTELVADAYATMAKFRLFVRNDATLDADDPDTPHELLALEAAARAIDTSCSRSFRVAGDTPTARVFTPSQSPAAYPDYSRYICQIDDLFDDTDIEVAFDETGNGDFGDPTTAYRLAPTNAPSKQRPYTLIVFDIGTPVPLRGDSVQVTALWGWDAIPTAVENANLVQASRFLKRRDAPFGVAGSPDMGNELRLLAKLDPDVAVMLAGYRRFY